MKCASLELLIKYIWNEIMSDDYDRHIELSIGDTEAIMTVFENEIPIRIHFEDVHFVDDNTLRNKLTAEVYTELCRCDIGRGWLAELDEICCAIEENEEIFRRLLQEGEKKDG